MSKKILMAALGMLIVLLIASFKFVLQWEPSAWLASLIAVWVMWMGHWLIPEKPPV